MGRRYLEELANSTGGREYRADSLQNMSYAFAQVAEELRRQYSIGYYPKRSPQAGMTADTSCKLRARPMATIRASCPDCGDVELTSHDMTVRLCVDDNRDVADSTAEQGEAA